MVRFFKLFLNVSQRNLLKNVVILFNIWREIGPIGILNGSLFLEKLVFVCVCCQIPLRHVPAKTKLECPLGLQISFEVIEETYIWSQCCFSPQIPLNLLNPPLFRVRGVDQYSGQVWKKKKKSKFVTEWSLAIREGIRCGKRRCDICKMTTIFAWLKI